MADIYLKDINREAESSALDMIKKAEDGYHEKIADVARRVKENKDIRLILLAGPSASGKTTTANLVCDAIKALGENAMVVSLDDFYRHHDDPKYPKFENGEMNYECPEALNLELLDGVLQGIVANRPYDIPKYDFKQGAAVETRHFAPIGDGCVIIEGLHALNPRISENLPAKNILKMFVSVSTNIVHEGRRIISGRKLRFVRRLVRDSIFRGSDAQRTLSMWLHVLEAEDIYLYAYKETADIAFDTFHPFEMGVMKSFALRLISRSLAERNGYANTVLSAMEMVSPIDAELVPENSLIREFISGGIYEELY